MNLLHSFVTSLMNLLSFLPEIFVNSSKAAIVSFLCLNLAVTPIFIACQTQLMLSVFAVLFFFINAALLLITLGLEYLGLAILLVYAGAIIMILLFVIMLVKLQETEEQPFSLMNPSKWQSSFLPLQTSHVKTRSIFLIAAIIIGASVLTYSCKAIVAEINSTPTSDFAPAINLFSSFSKDSAGSFATFFSELATKPTPRNLVFINTYDNNDVAPNHIPWIFQYYSDRLENKFRPIVLEHAQRGLWANLAFEKAPSYNPDRLTFNLIGRFGYLNNTLPVYPWVHLLDIKEIPSTGAPLDAIRELPFPEGNLKEWAFYPRTRLGVYDFPTEPIKLLHQNDDIPRLYALDVELKDLFPLPPTDISTISSVLYTLHAPTLVLAAICLFIAMVLSFLLTDFKMKS